MPDEKPYSIFAPHLTPEQRAKVVVEERIIITDPGTPRRLSMPDWPNYLTDTERAALDQLERRIAIDTKERRRLMNLAKQRKHRQKAQD